MKHKKYAALFLPLLILASCSFKTKEEVLVNSIVSVDVKLVDKQLVNGADPLKPTKANIIPIQKALIQVIGSNMDKDFLKKQQNYSDPKMQILRSVLRKTRLSSGTSEINETGPVYVTLQESGDFLEGGSFIIDVILETSKGEKLSLIFSTYETEYINVPSDRPFISIGKKYNIIGSRKGNIVEVYRIELLEKADNNNAMEFPTYYYLPSTYEYMKEYTWYGTIKESS